MCNVKTDYWSCGHFKVVTITGCSSWDVCQPRRIDGPTYAGNCGNKGCPNPSAEDATNGTGQDHLGETAA